MPLRRGGHSRQQSDELIEDLEFQLGDSQMDYVRVSLSYAHSAFPRQAFAEVTDGVSDVRSTLSTMVTGTLRRCNGSSPWSPQPAPSPNALFPLISQHWGKEKAGEAMQKMLAQRSTPRKPANNARCLRADQDTDGASWITVDTATYGNDLEESPAPARGESDEKAPILPRPARITTSEPANLTLELWLSEKVGDQDVTHSLRSIDSILHQYDHTGGCTQVNNDVLEIRDISSGILTNQTSKSLYDERASVAPTDKMFLRPQQTGGAGSSSKRSWFSGAETVEHSVKNYVNNSPGGGKKKELSKWAWASWF